MAYPSSMTGRIDRSAIKARARSFQFVPFRPEGPGVPLAEAGLRDDEELLVAERGGEAVGFVMRQMAYHHTAQGELAGKPYLVTF